MGVMSMTGFGTATASAGGRSYRVQIKAVNHKALSVRFHMPSAFAVAEAAARKHIKAVLKRGAIEVGVQREDDTAEGAAPPVAVDHAGASALMKALQALAADVGAPPPGLDLALRYGEFVSVGGDALEPEEAQTILLDGLRAAADALVIMRRREGEALAADLVQRLDRLDRIVALVETRAPEVLAKMEARLQAKLDAAEAKLGIALDAGRVAAELVVFSDRADMTEETVRARTHLARYKETLLAADDAERGKRLDFLSQELLRELNTMASKCRDTDIAGAVVDGKVELEKIREQVQNIV